MQCLGLARISILFKLELSGWELCQVGIVQVSIFQHMNCPGVSARVGSCPGVHYVYMIRVYPLFVQPVFVLLDEMDWTKKVERKWVGRKLGAQ